MQPKRLKFVTELEEFVSKKSQEYKLNEMETATALDMVRQWIQPEIHEVDEVKKDE